MELQEYKEIEYEIKNSTLPKQTVEKLLKICLEHVYKNGESEGVDLECKKRNV